MVWWPDDTWRYRTSGRCETAPFPLYVVRIEADVSAGSLWYDSDSLAGDNSLDLLKASYPVLVDLAVQDVVECSEAAVTLDTVSVGVTTIRSCWFVMRLVNSMASSAGPHVLRVYTVAPDDFVEMLRAADERVAALMAAGRLIVSDITHVRRM